MSQRSFTPYELNQLAKYNIQLESAFALGNTPIEYITGTVSFCNLDLIVSPAVLIPRVETEELVELVTRYISRLPTSKETLTIADVGTGSGAVGLAVFSESEPIKPINMILSDISQDALMIAAKNLKNFTHQYPAYPHHTQSTIQLITSDLLENIPENRFDIMTANLPYIPDARLSSLDSGVIDYEPRLALAGGENGFSIIYRFLLQAIPKLSKSGKIFLEVDDLHTQDFLQPNFAALHHTLSAFAFSEEFIKDSFGNQRFIVISRQAC